MRLRLLSQLQEPSITPSGTEPRAVHQDFWRIELSDLERELGAGAGGLSSAEAAARRVRFGANTLGERRRHSITLKFLSPFRNPLVLILLVAGLISALTGDVTSFILISTIVLMSAMLDMLQEHRGRSSRASQGFCRAQGESPARRPRDCRTGRRACAGRCRVAGRGRPGACRWPDPSSMRRC
jgi:Cation transporter/ATPase, N-terminus